MKKNSIKRVLFLFVFAGYSSLFAQGGLPQKECVIWDNSNVILPVYPSIPSDTKVVRFEGPNNKIIKSVSLPSAAYERDYLNNILYACGNIRERDAKTKQVVSSTHILWRREADNWLIDATIDALRSVIFPIIPLTNGKYLLVAIRPFIEDENGAYLFGIYKKKSKKSARIR